MNEWLRERGEVESDDGRMVGGGGGRMSNVVIKRHRDTGGDEWVREQENWTGGGE